MAYNIYKGKLDPQDTMYQFRRVRPQIPFIWILEQLTLYIVAYLGELLPIPPTG